MSQPSNSPILSFERVSKSFRSANNEITVLHEVTFELACGESCAVIGPSGSGKSTLLALAAGLDDVTSGCITLCGHNINQRTQDQRSLVRLHNVGFVFQSFQLIPTLTALENVSVPGELKGDSVREEARALLEQVGLSSREQHYPSQLSGGEQQRVALARAFINRPKIIFADEPTGNLDRENALKALDYMQKLQRDSGTSLLLVTHDLEVSARMSRQITLRGGEVVANAV